MLDECPYCGQPLDPDTDYRECPHCGRDLN